MAMTGRDLIVYILKNNLEDEPVFLEKGFLNLMTLRQAAVKFEVGVATVKTWFELGVIDGVMVGDEIYILPTSKCPVRVYNGGEKWIRVGDPLV